MAEDSALTDKIRSDLDLLQRHVALLKAVQKHQPIGIIRLAEMLDYPQHKVRYTLRVLEQEGLIVPSAEGATVTENLSTYLSRLRVVLEEMGTAVRSLKESL